MNTVEKVKQSKDIARLTKTVIRQQMHLNSCAPRFKEMHTRLMTEAVAELEARGYKAITVYGFDFRTGAYTTTTEIVEVA